MVALKCVPGTSQPKAKCKGLATPAPWGHPGRRRPPAANRKLAGPIKLLQEGFGTAQLVYTTRRHGHARGEDAQSRALEKGGAAGSAAAACASTLRGGLGDIATA